MNQLADQRTRRNSLCKNRAHVSIAAAVAAAIAMLTGCTAVDGSNGTGTSASTPALTVTTDPEPVESTDTNVADPSNDVRAVDPSSLSADGYGIAWVSPSGNIWCRISEGTYGSGCQARDAPVPDGANCVNPTFTVEQLSKGFYLHPDSVEPSCFNQGVFTTEHPTVLEYGQSVTTGGYTCVSRRSGMACATDNGHGFELSAESAPWF
ncbi:hypothetical protein O1W68_10755 [Rhodococcus sp. H36-A4]|uniref:DUF6636 domain-containing protein n=1 Tax=Rhodococcus sp. H36-A4 TaxID=3004353 RepID=UPI0022AF76B2|nr:DUF6636 domain-containing protein [Rhodococcus sp. H36-A4]MCZ4078421.1 hypothetical protein [Rhodococcus sp. H36-A4]